MKKDEFYHEFDDDDDYLNEEESTSARESIVFKFDSLTDDEKVIELEKLNKDLDELKTLFKLPRLYMSNFFSDLKRDIDVASVKHAANLNKDNLEQNNMLKKAWVDIIDRVTIFETECFNSLKTNKFNTEITQDLNKSISLIEEKLQNLTYKEDVIDLNEIIYENIFKLEKVIFQNRTITFIDKLQCKLYELFNEMDVKTTFGKLIIVRNYYFGKRGLNFLTRKFYLKENFPYLTNELLKSLNLKEILLNNINSEFIDEISLDFKLKTINYSYESVSKIDLDAFHDLNSLTSIFLIGNHLTYLEPTIFNGLSKLERVYFDSNKLKSLDVNIFKGLTELKEIYLSGNPLASDNFNFFNGLVNLVSIDLSHNQIVSLDNANIFQGLINLKKISLGNNQIKSLDKNTFKDLVNLSEIYLNDNQLEFIDTSLFTGLSQLNRIDLDNNQLNILEKPLLKDLSQLVWFNISGNQVKSIDPEFFLELTQLSQICLNGNELTTLDENLFKGLIKLQYINLHFNQLESLPDNIFNGLYSLNRIDLSKNQLVTLGSSIFKELDNLTEIKLSYNPFKTLDVNIFKELKTTTIVEMHGIVETEKLNSNLFINKPILRWRQRHSIIF